MVAQHPLNEPPLVERDDHAMDGGLRDAKECLEVILRRRAAMRVVRPMPAGPRSVWHLVGESDDRQARSHHPFQYRTASRSRWSSASRRAAPSAGSGPRPQSHPA